MKTNIMNLMMGTTGTQNTTGTAVEVDGALFSSLLQKVTGQSGIEPEAVFDQSGAEAVEKEENLPLDEAAAALVGMIFSKVPEENLQAKTPENILEESISFLKEVQGNPKDDLEFQQVSNLLCEALCKLGKVFERLQKRLTAPPQCGIRRLCIAGYISSVRNLQERILILS